MRFELGAPVALVHPRGAIGGGLFHLPRHEVVQLRPSGYGMDRRYVTRLVEMAAPSPDPWPTLCGLEGVVFAYASSIRERRLCSVCRAVAWRTGEGPLPSIAPVVVVTAADEERARRERARREEAVAQEGRLRLHHQYREPVAGFCMGRVDMGPVWLGPRCSFRATTEVDGVGYCKTHARKAQESPRELAVA